MELVRPSTYSVSNYIVICFFIDHRLLCILKHQLKWLSLRRKIVLPQRLLHHANAFSSAISSILSPIAIPPKRSRASGRSHRSNNSASRSQHGSTSVTRKSQSFAAGKSSFSYSPLMTTRSRLSSASNENVFFGSGSAVV